MKALPTYLIGLPTDAGQLNPVELMQNVSLQVKSPVGAIRHHAQMLKSSLKNQTGPFSQHLDKFVQRIDLKTHAITNILQDSMALIKYQEAAQSLVFEPMSTKDLKKTLILDYENYYPNVKFKIVDEAQLLFKVDKSTFLLAIKKLIDLALAVAEDTKPSISFLPEDGKVVVKVLAPELKIRKSEIDHIFDPLATDSVFHQVDALPLKLALVKRLLTLNRASVHIAHTEKDEIEFVIKLNGSQLMRGA